ncbi:MAG TPA: M28 family peptidase [Flavipsychrobacter sp.]|nr:M28 family peptidase [Flavipsychrobacter sp.]
MKKNALLFFCLVSFAFTTLAQSEKEWIKHQVRTLSGNKFSGRGYVNKGGEKAANYVARQFRELGLMPFTEDSSYLQSYSFSVNTFPGDMYLKINKKELVPGADFIIYEGSSGVSVENKKIRKIDLAKVKDSASWQKVKACLSREYAYQLTGYDTLVKYLSLKRRGLAQMLGPGIFILPKHGKITWSVARDTVAATIFTVEDTVLPKRLKRMSAIVQNKYFPAFTNKNAIAFVPGTEKPDSFIVFSAHMDHLGMMGRNTMFPGAHDNASGTSLMLYLAKYFAEHPAKYSIAFMAFSGEEAGLMGSKHYTQHAVFPLSQIAMVVNLDMTGDATEGITVVNGQEQKEAFTKLEAINNQRAYVPKMNQREQTSNSDHFSFSEKGVPAIFIFGLGAKGYYHDIFDKANELSFNNIDHLAHLLIDFVNKN